MGRLGPKHERFVKLRTNVRNLSEYPHLKEIAQRLSVVLDDVSVSIVSNQDIDHIIKRVEQILRILPQPEGDNCRFLFDAHMIAAFTNLLNKKSLLLSRMILPTCGEEWNHRPVYLPSFNAAEVPRVDLISFKGGTKLDDIVLLDYPWLYHELGHILVYEYWELFRTPFARVMDKVVRGLKARSLADSAINKRRAEATIEDLQRFWGIGNGPWSWAIEIGSDVVALWTCGPSFLDAFDMELDNREPNPYLISKQHPSYEIRSVGLMHAGSKLGWRKYTASLKDRMKLWKTSSFRKDRTNEYVSYANKEILDGAISSALEMCTDLKIPVCDKNKVKTVGNLVQDKAPLDFGDELVIAAWLVNQELGRNEYYSWKREIIEALSKKVRL